MFGMQKWEVGHRTEFVGTPFIREWALCNDNYKEELIEALLIIQANHVLIKLGLDIENLIVQFSPHQIEMNTHIHPMLKALYILCERLTKIQTKRLFEYMKKEQCTIDVEFDSEMFLEIYFIQWFLEDNVVLGDWKKDGTSREIFCDVTKITTFLKAEDDSLKEKILNVNIKFNFTRNNVIGKEKCKKNSSKSATDNASSSTASASTSSSKNSYNKKEITKELEVISPNGDKIMPRYDIFKESAGYLLVINQKVFKYNSKSAYKRVLHDRKGTDKDSQDLRETFERHGYENITETNLTDTEIIDSVKAVVKRSKNKDSLIVCILSHGIRGQIFGSNYMPVDIDLIKNILMGEELKHKPKMLLIQACQVDDETNERTTFKNVDGDYDLLVAWSAFPGKVSWRDIEEGSWFIQTICKEIKDYGNSHHIMDIMTEVSRKLKDKSGPNNESMININETNLTMKFFLPRSLP